MDRVVPCTLELVACDRHGGELLVGDLDSGRVVPLFELGVDLEALFCRRVRDQLDDDPVGGERATAPVHRDEAEQPVLDLVPLRGAGRVVTDRDLEAGLLGELGELDLPCPDPVAVRSASPEHPHEDLYSAWLLPDPNRTPLSVSSTLTPSASVGRLSKSSIWGIFPRTATSLPS